MKFSYYGLVFFLALRLSSAACGEGETCAQDDDGSSMLQTKVHTAEEKGLSTEETETAPLVMYEEVDVDEKAFSSGQANDPDAAAWLLSHNYYRCIHNTPEIQWDDDVALGSKKHALTGVMSHSKCYRIPAPRGPSGENLAAGQHDIAAAVRAWYNESPERGPGCGGHCTALLWKKSTALGCSKQDTWRGSRPLYVCRYAKTPANYGSKAAGVNAQDMSRECDCYKKYPVPKRWGNGEQCGLPVGSAAEKAAKAAAQSDRGENTPQQSSSGDRTTSGTPKASGNNKGGGGDWLPGLTEKIRSTEKSLDSLRALVVAAAGAETGGDTDLASFKNQVSKIAQGAKEMQGVLAKAEEAKAKAAEAAAKAAAEAAAKAKAKAAAAAAAAAAEAAAEAKAAELKAKAAQPKSSGPARNAGLTMEVYYTPRNQRNLNSYNTWGQSPRIRSRAATINYASTGGAWSGMSGRKDHFYVRWTGAVVIKSSDRYTFYLTSDDGSRMFIAGSMVVNNDGLHGMRERSGNRQLSAGKHPIRVDMFEKGGGAGCIFKYKGKDSNNQKVVVPQSVLLDATDAASFQEKKWRMAIYYFRQGGRLANLESKGPNAIKSVDKINYGAFRGNLPGTRRRDHFAVRFTARWLVSESKNYEFSLRSDDGSKLWIDGRQVVNNDGCHGMRDRTGKKNLSAGMHVIHVQWFERGGGAGCIFKFKPSGGSWDFLGSHVDGFGNPAGYTAPTPGAGICRSCRRCRGRHCRRRCRRCRRRRCRRCRGRRCRRCRR